MLWYYSTLAPFKSHIFILPLNAIGNAGTEGGTYTDTLSWKRTRWASGTLFQMEHWMLWKRAIHHTPVNLESIKSAILLNQRYKVSILNIFFMCGRVFCERMNISSISGRHPFHVELQNAFVLWYVRWVKTQTSHTFSELNTPWFSHTYLRMWCDNEEDILKRTNSK